MKAHVCLLINKKHNTDIDPQIIAHTGARVSREEKPRRCYMAQVSWGQVTWNFLAHQPIKDNNRIY